MQRWRFSVGTMSRWLTVTVASLSIFWLHLLDGCSRYTPCHSHVCTKIDRRVFPNLIGYLVEFLPSMAVLFALILPAKTYRTAFCERNYTSANSKFDYSLSKLIFLFLKLFRLKRSLPYRLTLFISHPDDIRTVRDWWKRQQFNFE
jgi:hypothetical protein